MATRTLVVPTPIQERISPGIEDLEQPHLTANADRLAREQRAAENRHALEKQRTQQQRAQASKSKNRQESAQETRERQRQLEMERMRAQKLAREERIAKRAANLEPIDRNSGSPDDNDNSDQDSDNDNDFQDIEDTLRRTDRSPIRRSTGGSPSGDPGNDPEDDPDDDSDDNGTSSGNNSSSEDDAALERKYRRAIINLSQGSRPRNKSRDKPVRVKVREPDPFDGSSPDKLRNFVISCHINFRARETDFRKDTNKINFAISYLKGTALELYEPYILGENFDDPNPRFLRNWRAFVNHLTDNFGVLHPEDEAEHQLKLVTFPDNGRAINFFTTFEKYKNRTRYGDRAYRNLAYEALPDRLKDEIAKIIPKPDTYGLVKRYALQIDQRYWERHQEQVNAAKLRKRLLKQTDPSSSSGSPSTPSKKKKGKSSSGHNSSTPAPSQNKSNSGSKSTSSTTQPKKDNEISKNLGPDGKLLPEVRQYRMDNGLCLFCGKKGHMANECSRKKDKPARGRNATITEVSDDEEQDSGSESTSESKN